MEISENLGCYGNHKVPKTYDWKNVCHHHSSFSFDLMFLKLSDKVDMDEISEKFEKRPDPVMNLSVISP